MTTRIAFFADAHIDYSYASHTDTSGVNLRVRDGYNALHEIIEDIVANRDKIDVVAMGGDMFHTSQPTVRSIAVVQHYLRALAKVGLPIHILAGNHDATDDRSYPAAVAVVDDPDRGIYAHYKPYDKLEIADGVLLHSLSHHGLHHDDVPVLEPHSDAINIFMSHGAAVDPKNAALMRCLDSPREQVISPELVLSEEFDLRVLGHYHSRYAVGGESLKTWYAGSTLRRGFSDAPGARGWTLFTVHDDRSIDVEHHDIFQRPQFDLPIIDAAGQTAAAIQELVITHIDGTREDESDGQFNPLRAPILRQRILNVTRSTREGLDRKLLATRADHSLKWLLDCVKPEITPLMQQMKSAEDKEKDAVTPSMSKNSSTLNVVDSYASWKDSSNVLSRLPQEYQVPVDTRVGEHLTKAHNDAVSS